MPQVDMETLVSACAGAVSCDNKVACETLAGAGVDDHPAHPPVEVSDLEPPESFWLSEDAELDWFDRNAFYERKDSGNRNSGSLNPNQHSAAATSSQRFSNIKPKTSFIGLPKTQKAAYVEAKSRRHKKPAGAAKMFPKRSGSTGKPGATSLVEPSSPKVSCIGRVRSRRDKNRRMRSRQRSKRLTETEKPRKAGFLENFRAVFRGRRKGKTTGGGNNPNLPDGDSYESPPARSRWTGDIRDRLPAGDSYAPAAAGIGGMKRFASGRKSAELLGVDVA